ncbi:pyridoxal phosphate-dependent aminotransferase [Nocardioides hungaricus]
MNLPPSGIREIVNRVFAIGSDRLLRLEIGEPDFAPPPHVVAAAHAAADEPVLYTPSVGILPLREALAARLTDRVGMPYDPWQVVVSQGAIQGIAACFHAILTPGDDVLIPDPGYPNYAMLATMVGARNVPYSLLPEHEFAPQVEELERLVTPRTRMIVINSPGNPTGAVWPAETVRAVVEFAAARGIWVLSDEVYDDLIFEGEPAHAARYAPDHVIGVYSFSKTFAMTGYRTGYLACPRPLADVLLVLQEPLISCCSAISQKAALAAITGPWDTVEDMRTTYARRRDLTHGLLQEAGFDVVRPRGAFYQMVPLAPGVDGRLAALDLVERGLAVAPGTAFGSTARSSIRLSLASDESTIRRGVELLAQWCIETGHGARLGELALDPA